MRTIAIKESLPLFTRETETPQIALERADYELRLNLLRKRMREDGIDIALLYGDREHFSNIEYFSSYDCRFEESILAIPAQGTPTILVGNEGMSYSYQIPYEIKRVYYRNFSLQGQPRRAEERLDRIFAEMGITPKTRVGMIGFKYFLPEYCLGDPKHCYDVPNYIMETLFGVADRDHVCNYTAVLTGLDGGIRLQVHTVKEIAAAEAAANRSASGFLRMLKNLRPGVVEYELSQNTRLGVAPVTMFSLVNFGAEHLSLGLRSPGDARRLELGEVCGLCYGIRGSLSSRVGVAAYNEATMQDDLRPSLFDFYGKFFDALCRWYEQLRVGASGNALHHAVHDLIGAPEYGVTLNCGHYTGMDEWTNSPSFDGSTHTLPDGAYLQTDIIASGSEPVRTAICEDAVIVAGKALREGLAKEYPDVWARICERRAAMIEHLGIELQEDVLPLSNLNGAMFPFMLNTNLVFAIGK